MFASVTYYHTGFTARADAFWFEFFFAYSFGDLEMQLQWNQSTDDFDAQANIRYDVYVNGRFEDVVLGSGGPRVIYGDLGNNLIEVFATDTAGNTSAAGAFTIFL